MGYRRMIDESAINFDKAMDRQAAGEVPKDTTLQPEEQEAEAPSQFDQFVEKTTTLGPESFESPMLKPSLDPAYVQYKKERLEEAYVSKARVLNPSKLVDLVPNPSVDGSSFNSPLAAEFNEYMRLPNFANAGIYAAKDVAGSVGEGFSELLNNPEASKALLRDVKLPFFNDMAGGVNFLVRKATGGNKVLQDFDKGLEDTANVIADSIIGDVVGGARDVLTSSVLKPLASTKSNKQTAVQAYRDFRLKNALDDASSYSEELEAWATEGWNFGTILPDIFTAAPSIAANATGIGAAITTTGTYGSYFKEGVKGAQETLRRESGDPTAELNPQQLSILAKWAATAAIGDVTGDRLVLSKLPSGAVKALNKDVAGKSLLTGLKFIKGYAGEAVAEGISSASRQQASNLGRGITDATAIKVSANAAAWGGGGVASSSALPDLANTIKNEAGPALNKARELIGEKERKDNTIAFLNELPEGFVRPTASYDTGNGAGNVVEGYDPLTAVQAGFSEANSVQKGDMKFSEDPAEASKEAGDLLSRLTRDVDNFRLMVEAVRENPDVDVDVRNTYESMYENMQSKLAEVTDQLSTYNPTMATKKTNPSRAIVDAAVKDKASYLDSEGKPISGEYNPFQEVQKAWSVVEEVLENNAELRSGSKPASRTAKIEARDIRTKVKERYKAAVVQLETAVDNAGELYSAVEQSDVPSSVKEMHREAYEQAKDSLAAYKSEFDTNTYPTKQTLPESFVADYVNDPVEVASNESPTPPQGPKGTAVPKETETTDSVRSLYDVGEGVGVNIPKDYSPRKEMTLVTGMINSIAKNTEEIGSSQTAEDFQAQLGRMEARIEQTQKNLAIWAAAEAKKDPSKAEAATQLYEAQVELAELATADLVRANLNLATSKASDANTRRKASEVTLRSLHKNVLTLAELRRLAKIPLISKDGANKANVAAAIATQDAIEQTEAVQAAANTAKQKSAAEVSKNYINGNPDRTGHLGIKDYIEQAFEAIRDGDKAKVKELTDNLQKWYSEGSNFVAKTAWLKELRNKERRMVLATIGRINIMAANPINVRDPRTDAQIAAEAIAEIRTGEESVVTPSPTVEPAVVAAPAAVPVSKQVNILIKKTLRELYQSKAAPDEKLKVLEAKMDELVTTFVNQQDKDAITEALSKEIGLLKTRIAKLAESAKPTPPTTVSAAKTAPTSTTLLESAKEVAEALLETEDPTAYVASLKESLLKAKQESIDNPIKDGSPQEAQIKDLEEFIVRAERRLVAYKKRRQQSDVVERTSRVDAEPLLSAEKNNFLNKVEEFSTAEDYLDYVSKRMKEIRENLSEVGAEVLNDLEAFAKDLGTFDEATTSESFNAAAELTKLDAEILQAEIEARIKAQVQKAVSKGLSKTSIAAYTKFVTAAIYGREYAKALSNRAAVPVQIALSSVIQGLAKSTEVSRKFIVGGKSRTEDPNLTLLVGVSLPDLVTSIGSKSLLQLMFPKAKEGEVSTMTDNSHLMASKEVFVAAALDKVESNPKVAEKLLQDQESADQVELQLRNLYDTIRYMVDNVSINEEGQVIVFQRDADGNVMYDENGEAIVDYSKGKSNPMLNKGKTVRSYTNPLTEFMVEGTGNYNQINPVVSATTAMAALNYLAMSGGKDLMRTKESIAELFGGSKTDTVPDYVYGEFSDKGTLLKLAASDMGKAIFRSIGVKYDPTKIPAGHQVDVEAALGAYAVQMLIASGYMEKSAVSASEFADYAAKVTKREYDSTSVTDNEGLVNFVRISLAPRITDDKGNSKPPVPTTHAQKAADLFGTMPSLAEGLMQDADTVHVVSETPASTLTNKGSKPNTTINKEIVESIREYAELPFSFVESMKAIVKLPIDEAEAIIINLVGLSDFDAMSFYEGRRKEKQAVYDNTVREIRQMLGALETRPDLVNNDFFMDSDVWVNLRNGFKNQDINGQGSKIHREFVTPTAHRVVVTAADFPALQDKLKEGLQSVFGIDEKSSIENGQGKLIQLEVAFSNVPENIQRAFEVFQGNVEGESVSLPNINEIQSWATSVGLWKTSKQGGISGLGGMSALVEAYNYHRFADALASGADTTSLNYTSRMDIEVDGVTNGFILLISQLPLLGTATANWLTKGGIFTKEQYSNFMEFANSNNLDSYETLGSTLLSILPKRAVGSELPSKENQVREFLEFFAGDLADENGGVKKTLRDLMKPAFMIFNYGAGLGRIGGEARTNLQQLVYDKVESIMKNAENPSPETVAELAQLNAYLGLTKKDAITFDNGLQYNQAFENRLQQILFSKDKKDKSIGNIYATAMQGAIKEHLEGLIPIRNTMNESFSSQWAVYKDLLDILAKQAEDRAASEGREVTQAEMDVIKSQVDPMLPRFYSPTGRRGSSEHIPVFKTEFSYSSDKKIVVGYRKFDMDGNVEGTTSLTTQPLHELITDGGVSGFSISVHAMDATIMARTYAALAKKTRESEDGTKYGVYGKHDAGGAGILSHVEFSQEANRQVLKLINEYSLISDFNEGFTEGLQYLGRFAGIPNLPFASLGNMHTKGVQLQNAVTEVNDAKSEMYGDEITIDQYPAIAGKGAIRDKVTPKQEKVPEKSIVAMRALRKLAAEAFRRDSNLESDNSLYEYIQAGDRIDAFYKQLDSAGVDTFRIDLTSAVVIAMTDDSLGPEVRQAAITALDAVMPSRVSEEGKFVKLTPQEEAAVVLVKNAIGVLTRSRAENAKTQAESIQSILFKGTREEKVQALKDLALLWNIDSAIDTDTAALFEVGSKLSAALLRGINPATESTLMTQLKSAKDINEMQKALSGVELNSDFPSPKVWGYNSKGLLESSDTTLKSMPNNLDIAAIAAGETASVVSSTSLKALVNLIESNDSVHISPEGNIQLNRVLDTLIGPALDKLAPVMLKFKNQLTDIGGSFGEISGSDIAIVQGSAVRTLNAQSGKEVFAHELTHRVTLEALLNDPALRAKAMAIYVKAAKVINPSVFLHRDTNNEVLYLTDQGAELAHAQEMYDYMFNNPDVITAPDGSKVSVGLVEFVAYGLTNPMMVSELISQTSRNERGSEEFNFLVGKDADSVIIKLFNAVYSAVGALIERMLGAPKGSNLHQQLFNLAMDMNNLQNQQSTKQAGLARRALEKLGFGTDKVNAAVGSLFERPYNFVSKGIKEAVRPSGSQYSPIHQAIRLEMLHTNLMLIGRGNEFAALKEKILADENPRLALDNALIQEVGISSEGIASSLANTIVGRVSNVGTGVQRVFDRMRSQVDRIREGTRKAIGESILKGFIQKTTKTEREAMNGVFVDSDFSSLIAEHGYYESLQYITSSSARTARTKALYAKLGKLTDETALKGMTIQIRGFGNYKVKGEPKENNQVRSVIGIVDRIAYERSGTVTDRDAAIKIVDELMTLSVLHNTDTSVLATVARVWKREFSANMEENGITNLLRLQSAANIEGKKMFESNPYSFEKGYSSQLYDKGIEQKNDLVSNKDELAKEGWKLELTHKSRAGDTQVGLYTRKTSRGSPFVQGMFGVQNERSIGTSIKESLTLVSGSFSGTNIRAVTEGAIKAYTTRAMRQVAGKPVPNIGAIPLPIFGPTGDIVDYAYVMSELHKTTILKKDRDVSTVLADVHASTVGKVNTRALNEEAVAALAEDYDKNYAENPEEFIWVNDKEFNSNGSVNKFYDQYRMIPYEARKDIEAKWGRGNGMPMRKGMVRLVLGGRKYTAADSTLAVKIQEKFPDMPLGGVRNMVATVETIWQEIVRIGKVGVVIKTPAVVGINLVSNIMLLAVNRIDPVTAMRDFAEGIIEMRKFEKLSNEMVILNAKLATTTTTAEGTRLRARIVRIETILDASPLKPLIEEGMFQSIIEELDSSGSGYVDQGVSWVNKKLEDSIGGRAANVVNAVPQFLFMGEKSSMFKLLNKATQYSDIISRYSYIKRETLRNAKRVDKVKTKDEIFNDAKAMFINYNLPDHQGLEYANAMGTVMFTKYYLGIQHVLAKMWKGQPVEAMLSLIGQLMLGDISDVYDDAFIAKDPTRVMYSPATHLDNFSTLYGWEFWKNLSPL